MPAQPDQIRAMFDRVAAAWAANDGRAVADFFTEDGSLINPFGQRADGRAAVAAMYAEYFAGMLRGTTTAVDLTSVRAVGDDHAFADAEQTIHAPDGRVVLAVHLAALLRREGEDWRFVDSRPYAVAPAPG
jgi:uncharacterized protein (TIGR02246 family)